MKAKILIASIFLFGASTFGQTTAFTYQGRLNDSTVTQPTNGAYDLQFSLFDSANNQIGATQTKLNVQVTGGVFSTVLDFGSNPFTAGAERLLEIAVKRSADPSYVTLTPRQPLTSTPYAIQTLNASLLGGLPAGQFVQTNDPRLTDPRDPLPGSTNYIQNGTNPQAGNFNVSGTGTIGGNLSANSVNTNTNFKIGNSIVFSTPLQTSLVAGYEANHLTVGANSVYLGWRAGFSSNGFAFSNTFVGSGAGHQTTVGWTNTFVGKDAGFNNVNGTGNSYFGVNAGTGSGNGSASSNAAFGYEAGYTISGTRNAFFGFQAGRQNQAAVDNAFFGYQAGTSATASENSFFGSGAGNSNTTGFANSFFGKGAGDSNTTGTQNVFIGAGAGSGNTTGSGNVYVGLGASNASQTGLNNTIIGRDAGGFGLNYDSNTAVGYQAGTGSRSSNNTFLGANTNVIGNGINNSTVIGAGATVDTSHTIMLGTNSDTVRAPNILSAGTVTAGQVNGGGLFVNAVATLYGLKLTANTGPGTGDDICLDSNSKVVICSSSSLRYKTNVSDYTGGLSVVRELRPITFTWKQDGVADVGFAAEEVEKADPNLVVYKNGQVEGVKYNRISIALVNAIKQQQQQIEELKALVCSLKPDAPVCIAQK